MLIWGGSRPRSTLLISASSEIEYKGGLPEPATLPLSPKSSRRFSPWPRTPIHSLVSGRLKEAKADRM
jgi:hypothetical protein